MSTNAMPQAMRMNSSHEGDAVDLMGSLAGQ